MNVDNLLRAAGVRRWHTEPQVGTPETVAHHSALVSLLADDLSQDEEQMTGQERYYLLRECLRHDMGEYWTGDLPAPAKHAFPSNLLDALDSVEAVQRLKAFGYADTPLLDVQTALLHLADTLAAAVHCAQQGLLGNREGARILKILVEYTSTQMKSTPLRLSTQIKALRLLRECAMITDSDMALIRINCLEATVCGKSNELP